MDIHILSIVEANVEERATQTFRKKEKFSSHHTSTHDLFSQQTCVLVMDSFNCKVLYPSHHN